MAMNILLLNEIEDSYICTLKHAHLPLWAGVLKALTPKEHNIDFIDCSFEDFPLEKLYNYNLVCLSAYTPNANKVYKIAKHCKNNNIKCIIGGPHASVLPKEAKRFCDSVVVGEAESIWKKILTDTENGKLMPFYDARKSEWDEVPYLDHSIFRKYKYSFDSIEVMRGCLYDCEFCTMAFFSRGRCKYKSISLFKKELDEIKLKNVILIGPNAVVDRSKAIQIFESIRPYNIRWGLYASGNLVIDNIEILDSLHKNGCYVINIGFENLSPYALKSMKKHHNIGIDYKKLISQLHDRGILVSGTFILGWDTDDKSVFRQVVEIVKEYDMDFPYAFILVPFPTTKLYYRLVKENRILTFDWSRYTGTDVVFQPKKLSVEDLLIGYIECTEQLCSLNSELRYAFRRNRNIKRKLESLIISYYHRKLGKEVTRVANNVLSQVKNVG
jgi:radical SAM superfamily enzyme YgiQ (UPF0313 family)